MACLTSRLVIIILVRMMAQQTYIAAWDNLLLSKEPVPLSVELLELLGGHLSIPGKDGDQDEGEEENKEDKEDEDKDENFKK